MGFPTAKTQAHMVRNTITNSTATPLDATRAQRIHGRESIKKIKGCSRASSSPATDFSGVLLPDKVQEQQMLLVDLFYVQCVPFILGMLEPL